MALLETLDSTSMTYSKDGVLLYVGGEGGAT